MKIGIGADTAFVTKPENCVEWEKVAKVTPWEPKPGNIFRVKDPLAVHRVQSHDGKADQGKVDVDRIDRYFPKALMEVAKVLEFGASKYGDSSWTNVPSGIRRYQAAARRHKLARNGGQIMDEESSLYHWAHQITSELMAFTLQLEEDDND